GIVATILDEIMTWAALYFTKKFVLTKSINVNYLKPVFTDTKIRVEGKVMEHLSEREVIMEGCVYNNDELRAKSTGEYVLIDSFR
ncbi:MAG: PaaI family thioesterase, partial [Smithella sp.]